MKTFPVKKVKVLQNVSVVIVYAFLYQYLYVRLFKRLIKSDGFSRIAFAAKGQRRLVVNAAVSPAVAAAEDDPSFREEHPGHSRSLYAAVSRNAEALWTPRGLEWFRKKLVRMASVNENVAIVMLGAVQDWRELPDGLRGSAETLLRGALGEIRAAAPAAESLAARIGDLLA